jgi:hypothetical protein
MKTMKSAARRMGLVVGALVAVRLLLACGGYFSPEVGPLHDAAAAEAPDCGADDDDYYGDAGPCS